MAELLASSTFFTGLDDNSLAASIATSKNNADLSTLVAVVNESKKQKQKQKTKKQMSVVVSRKGKYFVVEVDNP